MGTIIIDNTNKILMNIDKVKDKALSLAVGDITTIVKTGGRTPRLTGRMMAATRPNKVSQGHYQVIIPVVYATYQERGMRADGSHRVRKYTTAGTGKGFLQAALDTVGRNFNNLIRNAARMEGF